MQAGTLVDERFEVRSKAGAGGMGTVFRARDRRAGGDVALKILRGHEALDVERFTREATILAGLQHPGVVRYVAHGVTSEGEHYLAMEWLDGEELAGRLTRRGLSMQESLTVVRAAADALAVAHARGLIHRDLKPSNLFLVRGDVARVKVVDFGIARLGRDERRVTSTGALVGTPGYMAPEQIQGIGAYDPRVDVFSLGCVLFECLTGRVAFEGTNPMAVLGKILLQEIPRARALRPAIPEALDELVWRMMAREREDRPADGAAVVAEIDRFDPSALPGGAAPAVDPLHAAMATPPTPSSLTLSEQRLVSVVLAGDPLAAEAASSPRPDSGDLRAAVEPLGGHVDAVAGGSFIITLWSSGSAVDRAERAARCALSLMARFGELPVCVVTGRGLVAARVVDGDMIERGVRTLTVARPGSVLIDEVTAGMLGARFRVDHAGQLHLLRGERTAAESSPLLLGHVTRCVGRQRELSMLEGIFDGATMEPAASVALLVGAPGAGKSRIRRELLESVQRKGDAVEVLTGAGDSVSAGSPYRMLADALRRASGIRDEDPADIARGKLRTRMARHLDPNESETVVAFLGELAGVPFSDEGNEALRAARDSPRIMSDALHDAWETWLAAECQAQPMLLVLEDLQWGDAATVRLVGRTLRNLRDQPLMVLALARPEVHDVFPNLWAERDLQLVRLGPLPRKASIELVRAALGDQADETLVSRVVDRAGGNPFYLEELVRAVAAGRADVLPDSVLATVEARLDAEGAAAKRLLRAASVFGHRFSRRGVVALLGSEADLDNLLSSLVSRELLAPTGSEMARSPAGDPHYQFCHALVREAAYVTLTGPDRVLGHRLAAEVLEQSEHPDALAVAEHFRQGEEPARAVRWYRRAAAQALDADDLPAALERAARGAECGASGEELGHLLLIQAEADVWRGEPASAEERALIAVELFPPGSAAWFRALTQSVVSAAKQGGFDRIPSRAARAMQVAPAPGARTPQLVCLAQAAGTLIFGGQKDEADALLERIRRAAPDLDSLEEHVAAKLHQTFAFRALTAGDPGACLSGFEAALAALEVAGDRREACAVRSNLGFIFGELGDFESAEEALRGALAGAERMGLGDLVPVAMQNLGHVLAYRGRLEEARSYEQRSADAFQKLGDPRMEGLSHTYLAKIALFGGDAALAEREARAAADQLQVAPPARAAALALLARTLMQLGRTEEALPIAREAYGTLESLGGLEEGEALVRLVYAEALRASGQRLEFAQAVREARKRLLARAAKISDLAWRERFLTAVPDNARTLELSRRGVPI